jgi:hypothetical protein
MRTTEARNFLTDGETHILTSFLRLEAIMLLIVLLATVLASPATELKKAHLSTIFISAIQLCTWTKHCTEVCRKLKLKFAIVLVYTDGI